MVFHVSHNQHVGAFFLLFEIIRNTLRQHRRREGSKPFAVLDPTVQHVLHTGRARVGSSRNPLWRAGGTVFGPQPRSYAYRLPRKVIRGALRSALTQKFQAGEVLVVDQLAVDEPRTRHAAELLDRLDVTVKALLVDVHPDSKLLLAVRNIGAVQFVATGRLNTRDVVDARQVVMTRAAVERLAQVLGS